MPIGNVIRILINDSGSHFDANLVDVFLSISVDKIINVFLTESHIVFKDEDREFLKNYNLRDIYNFINNETSKEIVDLFNHYYTGNEC